MSKYVPLTEKYRPAVISDVIGQEEAKKTVGAWLRTGRIPSAIMITGQFSAGKTTLSRVIARVALCMNPSKGIPCRKCSGCELFDADNHQDYLEINAAKDRGIDFMKELADKLRLMPLYSNRKILMLDEAHQITDAAWKSWLKTLEEPPDHVMIIIATSQANKVPPEIASRCSRLPLAATTVEDCTEILWRVAQGEDDLKAAVTRESLARIARATHAHPRNALHALDQVYTMVIDAQESNGVLDTAIINGFIEQVAVSPVETAAVGIVSGILEGKPGGAMKRCEDYVAESDALLSHISRLMRQAMYYSVNTKLVDPHYRPVLEKLPVFAVDGARHAVLAAYKVFKDLRIATSNHTVDVSEVLDAAVAEAGLLIQRFNPPKKAAAPTTQAPAPKAKEPEPAAEPTTAAASAPAPKPRPKPPQEAADATDAPVTNRTKPGTPPARLPA